MSTENIVRFLQTAYSDEKLAALLAHAQDGKLAYSSCCCLIGITNAPHALQGEIYKLGLWPYPPEYQHYRDVRYSGGLMAEYEFYNLAQTDAERREKLIPLILAEIERREQAASNLTDKILVTA